VLFRFGGRAVNPRADCQGETYSGIDKPLAVPPESTRQSALCLYKPCWYGEKLYMRATRLREAISLAFAVAHNERVEKTLCVPSQIDVASHGASLGLCENFRPPIEVVADRPFRIGCKYKQEIRRGPIHSKKVPQCGGDAVPFGKARAQCYCFRVMVRKHSRQLRIIVIDVGVGVLICTIFYRWLCLREEMVRLDNNTSFVARCRTCQRGVPTATMVCKHVDSIFEDHCRLPRCSRIRDLELTASRGIAYAPTLPVSRRPKCTDIVQRRSEVLFKQSRPCLFFTSQTVSSTPCMVRGQQLSPGRRHD
jgi:hypothetical protein